MVSKSQMRCSTMAKSNQKSSKGGRPSKFNEPSRPVTLTLPDRILERLADIDTDRARAIVKAVDAVLGGGAPDACVVSELRVNGEEALLTVADSQLLRSIPWLTMIEIAPGRHLLSLKDQASIEKLEVTLGDILDAHPQAKPAERRTLQRLLECLRTPRRNRAIRTEDILVVQSQPQP